MRSHWQRKAVHMFLGGMLIFSAMPPLSAAEEAVSAPATQITQSIHSTQSVQASAISAEQAKVADLNILDTKISREEAIKIATSVFTIPEGYQNLEASLDSFRYENNPVWQIQWRQISPEFNYINVRVDANTGMILGYDRGGQNDEKSISFPPKVTYEQAVSIAKAFINKVYGEKATMFQYVDEESQRYGMVIRNAYDRYRVRLISMVDGVPFPGNSVTVGVDSNGEVTDMYADFYDNVQFASKENIKSAEEMMKLITEKTDMRLVYQNVSFRQDKKENEIVLAYQPMNIGYWDAVSGMQLDYSGKPLADHEDSHTLLATEKQADVPVKREQLVTEQEAAQILQDQFDIPEGIIVNSIRKEEKHFATSGPAWAFQFEYRTEHSGMGWMGAVVDAETGKVINFELSPYFYEMWRAEHGNDKTDNEKDYKINRAQALEKALQFVKKHNPEKLHQLAMADDLDVKIIYYGDRNEYPLHRFFFTREIDGIPFTNNNVSVTISGINGEVIDFNENWDWDAQFPQADNMIPVEQAKDVFLADKKVQMIYQVFGSKYEMINKGQKLEAKLVYRLNSEINVPYYIRANDGMLINAETGLPVSSDGEEGTADIKGHWAEKELAYLMQLQIIKADDDGNIHPDRNLTRGAFVDLFAKLTEPYFRYRFYGSNANEQPVFKDVPKDHEYYSAIQWAVGQGFVEKIEQFAPDRAITREEMAKFIVASMGLDALANQKGLFNLRFSDSNQIDYPGHVAIVDSIGIMKGSENKFRPDDPVTLAQAAKALTIYMNERGKYAPRSR